MLLREILRQSCKRYRSESIEEELPPIEKLEQASNAMTRVGPQGEANGNREIKMPPFYPTR